MLHYEPDDAVVQLAITWRWLIMRIYDSARTSILLVECCRPKSRPTWRKMLHRSLLIGLMLPCPLLGQQSTGVITGRVIGEEGYDLPALVVTIRGLSDLSGSIDPAGRFVIRNVPPGDHIVTASALDHDTDVAFIQIRAGDSAHVDLNLGVIDGSMPGTGYPLPAKPDLEKATAILPQLMENPAVVSFIQRQTSGLARSDTFHVWAPWMTHADTLTIAGQPAVLVSGECAACAQSHSYSLEGGRMYTAAAKHLYVTVRELRTGTKQFEYSLEVVERGDRVVHQGAYGRNILVLTYARRADDNWVPIETR